MANMSIAASISKMGGADDGTYKGLPIEVQGIGLYSDLRGVLHIKVQSAHLCICTLQHVLCTLPTVYPANLMVHSDCEAAS